MQISIHLRKLLELHKRHHLACLLLHQHVMGTRQEQGKGETLNIYQ